MYTELIAQHAKSATAEQIRNPESSFTDLGIDSVEQVRLLIDLEDACGAQLPEELLVPETFETVATLWEAFSARLPKASDTARAGPGAV
jgi:acyl carrier protein